MRVKRIEKRNKKTDKGQPSARVILYYFIYLLYNVITIQICRFKYKNSVNKD